MEGGYEASTLISTSQTSKFLEGRGGEEDFQLNVKAAAI